MNHSRPQTIAFYLPQFHPTPENSEWWGAGFTEWTNTAKATPLFRGHRQPRIPADLGFYDLRLAETRVAQSALAKQYGIDAFCYWHYWFGGGRRILERPFAEVLATGSPDHGFCLGWANQTWTGVWHGAEDRILIEQTYPGIEDERAHFEYLLPAFTDLRYVKVDGRPLFYIFRPEQLPDAAGFVARWRSMAHEAGLPGIYLVAEVSDLLGRGPRYKRVHEDGFDAGVYVRLPAQTGRIDVLRTRLLRKFLKHPERYRYAMQLPQPPPDVRSAVHPCVYPNWDNTPRAGRRGLVVERNTPRAFEAHVREAVHMTRKWPEAERLIFIKSWNEWAEGNHLEPDIVGGRKNLEAFASGLQETHG